MKNLIALTALIVTPTSLAHTFLIKSDEQAQQAKIMMTEQYFVGERELNPSRIQMLASTENGIVWLTENNAAAKTLNYTYPKDSTVLSANAMPRYRALKKGETASTPAQRLRIDDFAKAIVGNGEQPSTLQSGQPLEIVPHRHPGQLEVGDKLTFTVLFQGKPLASTVVRAGLASDKLSRLNTNAEGQFTITLTNEGTWLIRSKYESTGIDDYSGHYEAASSLLFDLQ